MNFTRVKIVVTVPVTHSDVVRKAFGDAGAGQMGNYSNCSFSSKGIGRFLPLLGAAPHVGEVGIPEEVEEEKIEVDCSIEKVEEVIQAMKEVHPYEEVAYDVYPLLDF